MSNKYIYPKDKFKISLDLEVEVNFAGAWGGLDKDWLEQRYKDMLDSGELEVMLKDFILGELQYKTIEPNNPEPFDRLCFEIKEYLF